MILFHHEKLKARRKQEKSKAYECIQYKTYGPKRCVVHEILETDTVKRMSEENLLTKKDLYTLSEKEVIDKIENCTDKKISNCFKLFTNSTQIHESNEPVLDKYCVSITAKRRYIVPLVEDANSYKRINDISDFAKKRIDKYLQFKTKKYAYLDFDF